MSMEVFEAHGPMLKVDKHSPGSLYYAKREADEVIQRMQKTIDRMTKEFAPSVIEIRRQAG